METLTGEEQRRVDELLDELFVLSEDLEKARCIDDVCSIEELNGKIAPIEKELNLLGA